MTNKLTASGTAGSVLPNTSPTPSLVTPAFRTSKDRPVRTLSPMTTSRPDVRSREISVSGDHRCASRVMENPADIAAGFRQHDFIGNIETIPTAYLRPGGGFDNLDQIATMYGVDIMVLLSYDQVQYTDEGLGELAAMSGVQAFPTRVKCATLGWHTLVAAIDKSKDSVSTE